MPISASDPVFSYGSTQYHVPPGTTLGIRITPVAGQVNTILKWMSGASLCELVGCAFGGTLTAEQLKLAANKGLLLYSGADAGLSPMVIPGAPTYYLIAQGATAVVSALIGRGAGDGVNASQA